MKNNKPSQLLFLKHILESIEQIEEYTISHSYEDFSVTTWDQLAITKLLENIGEAANNIYKETQQQYPHVPWRKL